MYIYIYIYTPLITICKTFAVETCTTLTMTSTMAKINCKYFSIENTFMIFYLIINYSNLYNMFCFYEMISK